MIKRIGDPFGAADPNGSSTWAAKFAVTAITVDPTCDGEFQTPSENGHFVRFDITGETTAALPAPGVFFAGWKVVAENGTTFNGLVETGAAYSCLQDTQRFPTVVGPAENVTGSIILDVPTAAGVAILPLDATQGWEWTFPAS